jgi:regulator of telomere elongation helicase 1
MCTCRGKLSEGLNFKGNLARACFVVGIPYLLVNDARVILKKDYLDGKCSCASQQSYMAAEAVTGTSWYKISAIKEVNQIIGRCIRDLEDYACIFLVDERYKDDSHLNLL